MVVLLLRGVSLREGTGALVLMDNPRVRSLYERREAMVLLDRLWMVPVYIRFVEQQEAMALLGRPCHWGRVLVVLWTMLTMLVLWFWWTWCFF